MDDWLGRLAKDCYRFEYFESLDLLMRIRKNGKKSPEVITEFNSIRSTIPLREFCEKYGKYWSNIDHMNAVDGIDAAICHLT